MNDRHAHAPPQMAALEAEGSPSSSAGAWHVMQMVLRSARCLDGCAPRVLGRGTVRTSLSPRCARAARDTPRTRSRPSRNHRSRQVVCGRRWRRGTRRSCDSERRRARRGFAARHPSGTCVKRATSPRARRPAGIVAGRADIAAQDLGSAEGSGIAPGPWQAVQRTPPSRRRACGRSCQVDRSSHRKPSDAATSVKPPSWSPRSPVTWHSRDR